MVSSLLLCISDCSGDRLHILNEFCLDNCPVSFYAVNTTVPAPSTTATTTTQSTSTAQTTQTSVATETTKPSTTPSSDNVSSSAPVTATTLQPSVTPGASTTNPASVTPLPGNASQTTYKLECLSCAVGCAKCVGPSPGQCMECLEGYNKTVSGACVFSPQGFRLTTTLIIVCLGLGAVAIFFIVFGVLQMCEPDSCLHRKKRYRPARMQSDVESFSDSLPANKISGLLNGVKYKNGSEKVRQPLLSSGSEDDLD